MDPLGDLGSDPELLAELRGARAAGVSWRRFTGWEPTRTTRFEYEDGRLARAVTTTEPEWDDEQRAAVYALLAFEASLCPGCKQPWDEVTAPEAEDRFLPGEVVRCHYCTARGQASSQTGDAVIPDALFYGVRDRQAEEGQPRW